MKTFSEGRLIYLHISEYGNRYQLYMAQAGRFCSQGLQQKSGRLRTALYENPLT